MSNHIEIQNLSKSFSKSGIVLQNLSLTIQKGEFVTLLGPSGSGKSTVLRLVAELDSSTSGSINIIHSKKFDCGYVFQDSSLLPWKTVYENVALPLALSKSSTQSSKIQQALELVGLSKDSHLLPHELSGGMKMRTSIARSLVLEPDLLLLDEPFSALDENLRLDLAFELRKIWQIKKMTVILVTHSIAESTFMSNRTLILSKRPSAIASDITINLPDARTSALRAQDIYFHEIQKVTQAYHAIYGGTK